MTSRTFSLSAAHKRLFRVLALILFAIDIPSQVMGQAFAIPEDGDTVIVGLPSSGMADVDQAKFLGILSYSLPPRDWPKVTVRTEQSIGDVVRAYFDYDARDQPATVSALIRIILAENDLTDDRLARGRVLAVPPLPVRALAGYGDGPVREFELKTRSYRMLAGPNDTTAVTRGALAYAGNLEPVRATPYTVIRAPVTATSVARAIAQSEEVTIETALEELPKCNDAATWLDESPFRDRLQKRVAGLSQADKKLLLTAARARALVIVDWDFGGRAGDHGSQVVAAAKYALASAGLDLLVPYIRTASVFPDTRADRESLLVALRHYEDQKYPGGTPAGDPMMDVSAAFGQAETWVKDYKPTQRVGSAVGAGKWSRKVHELVLAALLNRLFGRDGAVVNISFSVLPGVLTFLTPSDIARSTSFGVVAAGNRGELNPFGMPQDQAATNPQLVTVSYGTWGGKVHGSYSNLPFGLPVTVIGPGCGFGPEAVTRDVAGSSFASPYVAALAWAKALLDRLPARDLKLELVSSARTTVALDHPIESDGLLDPGLLLSRRSPTVILRSGVGVPVQDVVVTMTFTVEGDTISRTMQTGVAASEARVWIRLDACGDQTCAVVRRLVRGLRAPRELRVERGLVTRLQVTYVDTSGIRFSGDRVGYIRARIAEILF